VESPPCALAGTHRESRRWPHQWWTLAGYLKAHHSRGRLLGPPAQHIGPPERAISTARDRLSGRPKHVRCHRRGRKRSRPDSAIGAHRVTVRPRRGRPLCDSWPLRRSHRTTRPNAATERRLPTGCQPHRTKPLCVKGRFWSWPGRARRGPCRWQGVGRRVGCRVRAVTCPKSRLSGCEAGHAGIRVVPGCPPGPTLISVVVARGGQRRWRGVGRSRRRAGASTRAGLLWWSCPRRPCGRRSGDPVCRSGAG
jgi:hypothetical protein